MTTIPVLISFFFLGYRFWQDNKSPKTGNAIFCTVRYASPQKLTVTTSEDFDFAELSLANIEEHLILNTVPQDRHVFLTWNKYQGADDPDYDLYWRPVGDNQWNKIVVKSREHHAVTGLSNGVEYEFYVTVSNLELPRSHITQEAPRTRDNCSFPDEGWFCTQPAADLWLRDKGVDPSTLTCRGESLEAWDLNAPNCYYSTPDNSVNFRLLRSADSVFNPPPDRAPELIRSAAIQAIWPNSNPFDNATQFDTKVSKINNSLNPGYVTSFSEVHSYEIKYHPKLSSRITWFTPSQLGEGDHYAIYHEGHGGSGVEIGAETIDWLLERGWQVINIDMPLEGANTVDRSDELQNHDDFNNFDNGSQSPVGLFLLPVKAVVDLIHDMGNSSEEEINLMMIGRSGGAWTTTLYSAIDPRVDIAISVASPTPMSARLSPASPRIGDYEQNVPHLYDVVTYMDLMKTAGSKAYFYLYNKYDSCCARFDKNDELIEYLGNASQKKNQGVCVDEYNNKHSISQPAYVILDNFLANTPKHLPRNKDKEYGNQP